VQALLKNYSKKESIVCDPFGGCGTTLIEAKTSGHKSIGFDINPIAKLIAEAKLTPIKPALLDSEVSKLFTRIKKASSKNYTIHPRLKYWFKRKDLNQLNKIYRAILKVKDPVIKRFFLCGFSHILKNSSIWLMSSIKPTRDLNKTIPNSLETFSSHINSMVRKNTEYFNFLKENNLLKTKARMEVGDARNLSLKDNYVDLIITSPPYVTSYEYADLHQLSLLWLKYTKNLQKFRRQFIGTMSAHQSVKIQSAIGQSIINELAEVDRSTANRVNKYFTDMELAIKEMYRILKPGGHASIIIGNTTLKGVEIKNAQVAHEQMLRAGFKEKKIIKREIAFQVIAPWRDKADGRFTNKNNKNKKRIYQYEYIIIMEK
jgi:DNA modification methylase